MAWQGVEVHDAVVEQFRVALARGRLASTFLFVGPSGIGKRTFAIKLAQSLLCQASPEAALQPCGRCDACMQVLAGTHPDLELLGKPADRSFIPVATFIGDDQHRMREGLCHTISLKPFMGGRKIAIIDDADYLNEEGANCLLKTLEEPPPRSLLILIGTSADRQLPTIRSRCQVVRFKPLPAESVTRLLVSGGLVDDAADARRLAEFSGGSLEQAMQLADPELWEFRGRLLNQLPRVRLDSVELARGISTFVDEAGKDAAPRRNRTRQLIGFASEFFRQVLRSCSGLPSGGDADTQRAVQAALAMDGWDQERAAACLDRSLDALSHVDRNANQATLIECWVDDLAQILATGRVLVPRTV